MLRIKDVLKEKGITQVDLAVKMGVTRSAIVKMLSGNPTLGMLQKISSALNVHVLDLFDDDRKPVKPTFVCPHCHKPITVELK